MIVRDYQSDDFEPVIQLWWDFWHSSSGYQHHRAITDWEQRWYQLEKTHSIVVVEQLDQIVAFAALNTQRCVLSQLFVSPSWKRRGIGRQLMQWVSLQCPEGFTLRTSTANTESRAFYEKLGLVEAGRGVNDFNGKAEVEYASCPHE